MQKKKEQEQQTLWSAMEVLHAKLLVSRLDCARKKYNTYEQGKGYPERRAWWW